MATGISKTGRRPARDTTYQEIMDILIKIGIDVTDPIALQNDMRALRKMREQFDDREWQDDMTHLRRWRRLIDTAQSRGMVIVLGILLSGLAATLWIGFQKSVQPSAESQPPYRNIVHKNTQEALRDLNDSPSGDGPGYRYIPSDRYGARDTDGYLTGPLVGPQ